MSKELIWKEFFTNDWVAENGLARLVNKVEEGFNKEFPEHDQIGLETVKNDNGILFLAYFIALSHLNGLKSNIYSKHAEIGTTIQRLARLPHRGLFNRQPAGDKMPEKSEAHDNYVGIIAISRILGYTFIQEIVTYGVVNGWNYNNVSPGKFNIKYQRQPGEQAFYQLCHSGSVDIFAFIHMLIGILVNAFKKKDPGQNNLTWLRLYTLELGSTEQGPIPRLGLIVVGAIWNYMMIWRWDNLGNMFAAYFGDTHPITKMARQTKFDAWGL